ncbi:SMI1/KNR4 family protein [Saccharomonospora iraqiensis]|uniref:hypothetical protein n=1 Tax=Saccharomonospora iraqiensis TaxID=52698 RepID=UPI0012B52AFC|nr:hypothetical protein [Saccharomonospora iraqiensis]
MIEYVERLKSLVPPPDGRSGRIDWQEIETRIGNLPGDYKRLVEDYGEGSFDDFITVLHPSGNEHIDLATVNSEVIWSLRSLEEADEAIPYGIADGQAGITPWAVSDNGDLCFWVRDPVDVPASWKVVVKEGRSPIWEYFDGSATEFLYSVLSGLHRSSIFPQDFPSSGVRFHRSRMTS